MARWDGIDEFIEVAETGSFTAASERLGVSKSYISKQMKSLEERFGARLLQRTTRRMTLTEVGEVFFDQCKLMAAQFDTTESLVSQLQNEPVGTLKVALNGTYGVRYMAAATADFAKLNPHLSVEITTSYHDVDMAAEAYDVSIRYGDLLDSSNLVARKLGAHCLYLYATQEYLSRHGVPKKIDDLKDHNCLVGPNRVWYFNSAERVTKLRVDGTWVSEDGGTLLAAACSGLGIVQLPDFYVQSEIEEGKLVKLDEPWLRFYRMSWAVYPKSRHLSAKVRHFIDYLIGYVGSLRPSTPTKEATQPS